MNAKRKSHKCTSKIHKCGKPSVMGKDSLKVTLSVVFDHETNKTGIVRLCNHPLYS